MKDVAAVNAAKVQLAPIYAEMAGPAAALGAMSEDQRDVAMGSALPQVHVDGHEHGVAHDPALVQPGTGRGGR